MIDTVNDSLNVVVEEVGDTMQNVVERVSNDTIASADAFSLLTWMEQHTVLVSVVIFVLGWLLTRLFGRIDNCIKRSNYRKAVLGWIRIIVPIEEKFANSLTDLAEKLKVTDDMQPLKYEMPLTMPDKIKDMSVEQMMDSFMHGWYCDEAKKKRTAHMYNIMSNFEFLSKINDGVKESYDTYNKQSFALCQDWNESYVAFVDKYNSLPKGNPYEATVVNWWKALLTKPNSVEVHLTYLDKLDTISFQAKDNDILSLVNRMHLIAKQSQSTSKGFSVVFSNIADNINATLSTLSEDEQYFR